MILVLILVLFCLVFDVGDDTGGGLGLLWFLFLVVVGGWWLVDDVAGGALVMMKKSWFLSDFFLDKIDFLMYNSD